MNPSKERLLKLYVAVDMFGSVLMFILDITGVIKFNKVCLEEENIHVSIMVV